MIKSLTEIKGDDALYFVADLIEPAGTIMSDPEVRDAYYNKNRLAAVPVAIRNHMKECKTIVALFMNEDPKKYEPTALDIPRILMMIMNDPEVDELFTLQSQRSEGDTAGSALENTKE